MLSVNRNIIFKEEHDLDNKTFYKFVEIIYKHSGIALKPGKEALVQARVAKRLRATGISDYNEYIEFIKKDEDELWKLIDVATTNVTHFFREPKSFDFIQKTVREWAENGQRKFRFWSAASSTGEEPYTLAIVLREALRDLWHKMNFDIKILATDISDTVLKQAMKGEYPEEKMKKMDKKILNQHFCCVNNNGMKCYKINQELKNMIVYRKFNLMEDNYPLKGPIDIVLCRNVMIYFDNPTRSQIVRKIHGIIRSDGFLILGNAETLTTEGDIYKSVQPSVYRKK